jgi:uncharacterized membrane protein
MTDFRSTIYTLTYVAGLPPGAFWNTPGDGGAYYHLGDSLVDAHHGGHFRMFFYSNTTAFVACLLIIVLLLGKNTGGGRTSPSFALQVFVLGALLGLLAAYAAGSCRSTDSSVYLVRLFGPVLAFIFLVMVIIICVKRLRDSPPNHSTGRVNNDRYVYVRPQQHFHIFCQHHSACRPTSMLIGHSFCQLDSVVDDPGVQTTTNGQASTSFSQQGINKQRRSSHLFCCLRISWQPSLTRRG